MVGYQPSWVPGPPPSEPSGKGIPKWRPLALLAGVVILLSNLPGGGPTAVQADAFAGNEVSCTTTPTVLTTFSQVGYSYASIAFHLNIPAGGTVMGRWQSTTGALGPAAFWSAGTSGALDYWVTAAGVTFPSGGTGTVSYVVQKAADYGGCYTIADTSVARVPVGSLPQVSAGPTGEVDPAPDATAAPTAPPGYTCADVTVESCDEAPVGFCWVATTGTWGGYAGDPYLVPCEAEGNGTSFPGAEGEYYIAHCDYSEAHSGSLGGCQADNGVHMEGGDVWGYEMTLRGTQDTGYGTKGAFGTMTPLWGTESCVPWSWPTFGCPAADVDVGALAGGSTASGTFDGEMTVPGTGEGTYHFVAGGSCGFTPPATFASCGMYNAGGQDVQLHLIERDGEELADGDGDGWSDNAEDECGSDPEDPESVCVGAPEGFPDPSGLPNQPGQGGGPIDQCEGEDDGGLLMCQGGFEFPEFPSFPPGMCAAASPGGPTPAIQACASVPSAYPNASGDIFTGYQPDPSGFMAQLAGKAPFGIVGQLEDALGGAYAAPAGADVDLCKDIPVMGSDIEFCIPTDAFEAIAEYRPWMAAIVWLATALALLAVVVGSVGGRTAAEKD